MCKAVGALEAVGVLVVVDVLVEVTVLVGDRCSQGEVGVLGTQYLGS